MNGEVRGPARCRFEPLIHLREVECAKCGADLCEHCELVRPLGTCASCAAKAREAIRTRMRNRALMRGVDRRARGR